MSDNLKRGEVIGGRWEVEKVLAGGMGVVYIVTDRETNERLAAKTYRGDGLNAGVVRRFEREATTWINIPPHQNIVLAKFYQLIDERPFLFLEYVGGGNLSDRLGSLSPRSSDDRSTSRFDHLSRDYLRLNEMHHLALQFCDGMIHASASGVSVHRDIKPSNCLLDSRLTLKIADFGLAKALDALHIAPALDALHIAPAQTKPRILFVSPRSASLLEVLPEPPILRFLKPHYDVSVVDNIEQAAIANTRDSFDLVLLRIVSPFDGSPVDGIAAASRIRDEGERSIGRDTPIIAMLPRSTTQSMDALGQQCIEAGINAFLCEPIQSDDLFRALDTVIQDGETPKSGKGSSRAVVRATQDTPISTRPWDTLSLLATNTGTVAGTPTHMSPEQFLGLNRADVRSDIYSFGVMLYQMVNGHLPFSGATWMDYQQLHNSATPPAVQSAFVSLNKVIMRCLSKIPEYRFVDFLEIRTELANAVFDPSVPETDEGWIGMASRELDVDELLQIAKSQQALGDSSRALATLRKVTERNPANGRVWQEMGVLLMHKLSRYREALECLKKADSLGQDVDEEICKCREQLE